MYKAQHQTGCNLVLPLELRTNLHLINETVQDNKGVQRFLSKLHLLDTKVLQSSVAAFAFLSWKASRWDHWHDKAIRNELNYIFEALSAITLHCSFMAKSCASFLSSRAVNLTFSSINFCTSASFCNFSLSNCVVLATSLVYIKQTQHRTFPRCRNIS